MKLFFKPKSVFKEEREIAARYFDLVDHRVALHLISGVGSTPVVAKYSVSEDYSEYLKDLSSLGLRAINNYNQFSWSSKISSWYWDLENFTPKTLFNPFSNPFSIETLKKNGGPYFVRYDTKSKRELWKTHCYAETFEDLIKTSIKLSEDYKYENDTIAVREFVELMTFNDVSPTEGKSSSGLSDDQSQRGNIFRSFSGQPIVKEFRVHRAYGQELCRHFYWEPFQKEIEAQHGELDASCIPAEWLKSITDIADLNSNFYVLDVAQKSNGDWTLIEVNEGQQSGVHTDHLDEYYSNLKTILSKHK